jgi:hypothetical protein
MCLITSFFKSLTEKIMSTHLLKSLAYGDTSTLACLSLKQALKLTFTWFQGKIAEGLAEGLLPEAWTMMDSQQIMWRLSTSLSNGTSKEACKLRHLCKLEVQSLLCGA